MTPPNPFSPRLLAAWIAAATLTFALSFAFMLHGDGGTTAGPSSFSRSAIGYAGIADILQHRGLTVIKSRGGSLHRLGTGGVLVVAEPELHQPVPAAQQALLRAPTVLLVLPKWLGQPDSRNPAWIGQADPLPLFFPQSDLSISIARGEVVRRDGPVTWRYNELGPEPHLTKPVQLVQSAGLRPIVGGNDGMLVGELRSSANRRLWVLSDPDVLENHGLGDGNATFAVALFDAMRRGGRTIVFDETVHGFEALPANPAAVLLHPPFTQVLVQVLLALAMLLWAATGRFGAPEIAPPTLKAGKRDLVRNVAALFRFGRCQPVLVRRYVEETIRDVARELHVPRQLDGAAGLGWLQRLGAARGVSLDCADLNTRAAALAERGRTRAAELGRLPAEIWQWKQEMMHGAARSPAGRRGHPGGDPQGRGRPG